MPYVVSGYWTAGYAEGDQVNMDVSWIVFDVLAASLTLTQSARYDNTPDTFYSPTIAQLTPLTQASRFDNTSTFFSSTITTTVSLTQNTRYDNTPDTFYTPTVTPGTVTLNQGTRYDNTPDSFFSPTTTVGPVTLTQASRFDNSTTFFGHAIGTLILPNRYDSTNTFYSATVTPGPVTITQSSRYNNVNTFFNNTLTSLYSLTQNTRYDNTPDTFYTTTVTPGTVALSQATRYDNTPDTFYSPVLNLALTQSSRYNNTNNFFAPSLNLVLTQNTRYDNTPDTFYTVTLAQALIQVSRYDNTPHTFYSPKVNLTLNQTTRFNNSNNFFTPVLKVINDLSGTGTTSTQVNSTGIAQPIYTTDTVQVNSTTVNTISKNTKLGILYKNIGDLATLSSTSTAISGFPLVNLQSEHKYKLWRVSGNTASFSMTWTTGQTISAIIFPISNLNSSAIIRVRTYADEAGTAIISDTGNQQPILSTQESVGINNYSHYSNSIARVFVSKVSNIKHCKVDITDTTPQGYIEISRLVCGEIWNPTYGTSYGLSSVFLSDSKHERTEAGNIYTDRKNTYKSISFDLNYLTLEDRQNLLKLINTSGTRNPLFVSIFPNSEDPIKEETYQIYGKIVDSPTLNNLMYSMYSTNLTLESV